MTEATRPSRSRCPKSRLLHVTASRWPSRRTNAAILRPLWRDGRDDARLGPADRDDRSPRPRSCAPARRSPTASSSPGSARRRPRSRFGSTGRSRRARRSAGTGKPYWQGRVDGPGDGELRSPGVRISSAGFYTFHETLVARASTSPAPTTTCADVAETSLGAPGIVTGRGDVDPHGHRSARACRDEPVSRDDRPRSGSTRPSPRGIDLRQGVLAVVARTSTRPAGGSNGATQASPSGAIVIAGHVDSATGEAQARSSRSSRARGARSSSSPPPRRDERGIASCPYSRCRSRAADLDLVAEGAEPPRPRDVRRYLRRGERPLSRRHRGHRGPRLAGTPPGHGLPTAVRREYA